ncbi:kptA [Symbiodinium microadriaticum]|nr:kptA [Symbiodinium microadriaticum]
MSLGTDRKFVGPCAIGVSKLGQRGAKDLHRLLEQHRLVAANTLSVRKPATHVQGNSTSQIDFVLLPQNQAQGPGKSCSPCRQCAVASWRDGSRHFPLLGKLLCSRRYSAQPRKACDQLAMEDCYRQASDKIERYTAHVDAALEDQEPSRTGLRSAMEKAMQTEFPRQKGTRPHRAAEIWDQRKALRNIPEVLLALADLRRQLKQRIVWRTWAALARQSAEARTAKQRKFAQRQALIDEQLRQAEAKSAMDGSHSLYKVIRTFKRGRPSERVQLRDEKGRFLTAAEERKGVEEYSRELFGKGEDFQLDGVTGELGITSSEVVDQLRSIKLGKAVPKNCPPTVAWRATGPVKRGIEQGCKLAPSLFAFATFLLFRKLGEHRDIEALKQILTLYADDTLLQMHFDDLPQLQEALRRLLLDQLTELGFLRRKGLKTAKAQVVQRLKQWMPREGTPNSVCSFCKHMSYRRLHSDRLFRSRQKPSPALTSFLRTRKGLNGEDLVSKLGPVTAHPGHWYKFPFSAPNKLDISDDQADTGFHGTHLECMRAILATGMLLPSDPGIIGTRAFADRGGVYLHGPSIAISPKIIARSPDMAPNASSLNISSRFASMQGEQSYFDSVKIVAVHLRIATKENLRVSEYLMEWAGALELPLSSAKQAFYRPLKWSSCSRVQRPPAATWCCQRQEMTHLKFKSGWAEKDRWETTVMPPKLAVDAAGWAKVEEVLAWPRICETSATSGDLLEIVRSNKKQRYQLGLRNDGCRFIRAVQRHSRAEVGEENLLEPVSEEQLPDTLLHGTSWHSYDSIQQRGLLPGKAQYPKGKGGKKGREGRQHVHFFDDTGGVSGKRESSTMLVRISTRKAVEQGVRIFHKSQWGVFNS